MVKGLGCTIRVLAWSPSFALTGCKVWGKVTHTLEASVSSSVYQEHDTHN